MASKSTIKSSLIAPCGMNCGLCYAYLREKNKCLGCREIDVNKPISVTKCSIKNCDELNNKNLKFCNKCKKLPCQRIKHLDKRYRTKYYMSMIENLEYISIHGIREFVKKEKVRWTCSKCGGIICVHRGACNDCGAKLSSNI